MKRKIFSIILCMMLAVSLVTYSYAATTSELNNQKNDLENKKEEAQENIKEVKEEISQTLVNIQELDISIEQKQDEITSLNREISSLEEDIKEKEANIEQKEKEYDETDALLRERLVAMYEAGETSYLDVLFTSDSIMDFISKYYFETEIAEYDTALMEKIEKERIAIENEKAKIEKDKLKIEQNKKDIQDKQTELKVKKAQRQTQVAALSQEEKDLQAEIEAVTKEIQAVENEILRIAAEEARKNQSGSGHVYTGGALQWPCPVYSRISSYFGKRGSPLVGGSSYHKGIDIAAANGNTIVAAEAGSVIKVVNGCSHNYGKKRSCGCGGGYGNYVMVSHGSGLVTIYAHCASISVSKGQNVSKGQKIATVGSTGASTGAHLHFGVALNGTYVDPMKYLQ